MLELVMNKALHARLSKSELRGWEGAFDKITERREDISTVMDQALALEMDSVGSWVQLGTSLNILKMYGAASLSFRVASGADATNEWAWKGLVESETELNRGFVEWPFQYTIDEIDTSPKSLKSKTWLDLAKDKEDKAMQIRMTTRSLQLGQKLKDVWKFIEDLIKQTRKYHLTPPTEEFTPKQKREYESKLKDEGNAWWFLGSLFESIGEKKKRDLCHRTMNAIVRGIDEVEFSVDGKRAVEWE